MFHNNCQAVLFSILSSLSPSHPVTLGLPCLFLSSCPPPSPLPAATWHHHPPLLPSAPRLPTDSRTETNCRETLSLCKILGKHLRGIKSNKTFSFWNYARESSHVIKFPVFIEWWEKEERETEVFFKSPNLSLLEMLLAAREKLEGDDGEEYFFRPKASFLELLLEGRNTAATSEETKWEGGGEWDNEEKGRNGETSGERGRR